MTDTTRVNSETPLPVPGSQARHYDRANYVPQTRAALETLYGR